MPLYEFQCDDCRKKFEVLFRSMTERRPPVCPHCESRKVRKQFSTFATRGTAKGQGGGGGCASCHGKSCAACR